MARSLVKPILLACCIAASPVALGGIAPASGASPESSYFNKLQLAFETNVGQAGRDVKYAVRGPGYQLLLTPDERILILSGQAAGSEPAAAKGNTVLRFRFDGSAPARTLVPSDRMALKTNYIFDGPKDENFVNIPNFAKVTYRSLYRGIDLVYYGNNEQLEYDFVVAPGADVGAIKLRIDGADSLQVSREGELHVATAAGTLVNRKPIAYQTIRGKRIDVPVSYKLSEDGRVAMLAPGHYDRSRTLVIDPIISFSAYVGASNTGLAVDANGNPYLAGTTTNAALPTGSVGYQTGYTGVSAAYVLKLDPLGTKALYATYFGVRSATVQGYGIVVDRSGNAYLHGRTDSASLPITAGAYKTTKPTSGYVAFLTKFNATGTALVYSTYVPSALIKALAVDAAGSVFMTGQSQGLTATPGAYQTTGNYVTFVAKLNAAGSSMNYLTFVNETSQGVGIALDQTGNAYVTGTTESRLFPTTSGVAQASLKGLQDAWVAKLNASGSALLYGTYLGGMANDEAKGIAVTPDGEAVIVGKTASEDFPVSDEAFQRYKGYPGQVPSNGFVAKLRADGALAYASYLGGTHCTGCGAYPDEDAAVSVAVDAAGQAYVSGYAGSVAFPRVDAVRPAPTEYLDTEWYAPFITKINSSGSEMLFSMVFGARSQNGRRGSAVVLDANNNVFVWGSTLFPSTAGVVTSNSADVLVKIAPPKVLVTLTSSTNPSTPQANVTITAKVQAAQRGGTITFLSNGLEIGAAPVVDGLATVQISPGAGIHKITALFSLDGKTSPPLYQLVNAK